MTDVYADGASVPDPPVNVRIHYLDGSEEPVELTYEGLDEDGLHLWVATPLQPPISSYVTVKIDRLPPQTTVALRLPEGHP
jgi:hypothetical protein